MSVRDDSPPVSLFSFQDIITSITGIMFLVVLLLALIILDSSILNSASEEKSSAPPPAQVYSAKRFAQEGKNSLRKPVVCEQSSCFSR